MMKKLGIVLMAAFFSVSVAGLSFADEMKHGAMPAATGAPANPCTGKEMKKEEPKKAKKAAKKTAAKKTEEAPAAPASAPATEKPGKK